MPHAKRAIAPCVLSTIFLTLAALTAMAVTTETVLYSFPGSGSGSNPYANLVADTTGALYGTTGGGGCDSSKRHIVPFQAWVDTACSKASRLSDC